MNNQETVTISRKSYDELNSKSRELAIIKVNKVSICHEAITHTSQSGKVRQIGERYSIVPVSENQLLEVFKIEIEELNKIHQSQIRHIRDQTPSFKKLFLGLYYKG